MSYQEKRTVVNLVTGIVVIGAYCVYAFGGLHAGTLGAEDTKAWAVAMLVFIGIGVAAAVVIQIVFHILLSITIAVKERKYDDKEIDGAIKATMTEDEMDKLIELKSSKTTFLFTGLGFIAALVSLVLGYSAVVMLNILFLSIFTGSLGEGITSLYFYRKGIKNG